MALDREGIRRLAAGGGAGGTEAHRLLVHLPDLNEDVWVRRLDRAERQEVTLWAGARMGLLDEDLDAGDDSFTAEQTARMATLVSVGALRFAMCDGNGASLIESFDEADAVFNGLSDTDWDKLNVAFGELRVTTDVQDVEAGKSSSGTGPESSPSTP